MMKEQGIVDIYYLQETWLTKNFINHENSFLMFHHGLKSPACNRAGTGGVAILLYLTKCKKSMGQDHVLA
eukprot:scaffold225470_cov64-Attheya_sp.AAC.4